MTIRSALVIAFGAAAAAAVGAGMGNGGGDSGRDVAGALEQLQQRAAEARCPRRSSVRRYVSSRGSDRNPGTFRRPWRTIQKAADALEAGQVAYLRAGRYPEWVTVRRGGRAQLPITLRAYGRERPLVTGRVKVEASHVCLAGVVFDGGTPVNRTSVMVYISGGDDVKVVGTEIRNAALSGIFVGDEGNEAVDATIVGNYIHDNGTHARLDHGIYLGHARRALVANNVLTRNLAVGLKIAPEANEVLAGQNTVVGNGTFGIIVAGDSQWTSNDNVVANNIVANNGSWGIRTWWETKTGLGNVALRNLVWGNGHGPFYFPGGGLVEQESVLERPLFVNPSKANFRLRLRSPGLGRALSEYSMPLDHDGRRRPKGNGADLGAFER